MHTATFLVALQHAAAGEAGDAPCDRRCGLKLTCGALNRSFTCEGTVQEQVAAALAMLS